MSSSRGSMHRWSGAGTMAAVAAVIAAGAPAQAAGHRHDGAAGTISTVADGAGGPGLATRVAIWYPCGVTSHAGQLYVGDGLVQRVSEASGRLTTAAGGVRRVVLPGQNVPLGDGGPAASAATSACGTAVDGHANVLFADTIDREVRVVGPGRDASTGGP